MNNSIQRFDFKGAALRTLTDENGEPWFVAKDVCDVLGYTNASKAISDHVDSEDKLNNESLLSLESLETTAGKLNVKTTTSYPMLNIGRQNCQISSYGV